MKKIVSIVLALSVILAVYVAWNLFGPVVSIPGNKYLYVPTGATYGDVKNEIKVTHILSNTFFFDKVAKRVGYDKNIRPGRYLVQENSSLISLVRMLKAGTQDPVKLVINKLRTKEDLASKIGKNFECDSTQVIRFLTSNDSLKTYGLDSNTVMTAVIPDTYLFSWNGSFKKIFNRLKDEEEKFWTRERKAKAQAKGLTTAQVYTLASVVEEETNKPEDKLLIASTYMNRLQKGMKLGADPTVKYAMRDFGLKRILYGHLQYESPYNTYKHGGLPPGPICTPSPKTIDAVLDAPETRYLFFVAKPDFRGYSNFAETFTQHQAFAKAYQKALDSLIISKQNK